MPTDIINFLKQIAADQGHHITDQEALRAHHVIKNCIEDDQGYHFEAKSYFQN